MTTIQSDNYSIIVGKDVFSSFDFSSYSKIAILVDLLGKKAFKKVLIFSETKRFLFKRFEAQ